MPVTFGNTDTKRIAFGSRGAAKDIRGELPEAALLESDDGRQKTVQIDTSAVDKETLRTVEGKAAVSRDDATESSGGEYKI